MTRNTLFSIAAVAILLIVASIVGYGHEAAALVTSGVVLGITFSQIPTALRVPFIAVEFSTSRADQGAALMPYRVLLIGQKTSGGAGTANTIQRVSTVADVISLAGRGSMLHRMALAYFNNNRQTETYVGLLADNGAGTAATGTITVTGPATASGTLPLYLGGVRVDVTITSGDAQNTIATAIGAAINAAADLPVTATVATNVVTITHRHKGEVGNQYDIRAAYMDGESIPAGVSLAIVAMSAGASNPVLTSLIAAMGDNPYHVIAHAYTDATSLSAIEAELARRAGPLVQADGMAFTAKSDTLSNMATLGTGRNSENSVIVDANSSPTPPTEYAGAVAGVVAIYGSADPAKPFQTLPLVGVLPPTESARRTTTERNTLLFDGIATTRVEGGNVVLDRLVTTYQTSGSVPDPSYLDVPTRLTLTYLRYSLRAWLGAKFPRHKLADDSARFSQGQDVATPKIIKAEVVSWARNMEAKGLIENVDTFKDNLVVERDADDRNRINLLVPPDLINQLMVTAVRVDFVL